MNIGKILGRLVVVGYVTMALFTGVSRSRNCVAGSVVTPEPNKYGIVGSIVAGAFWPVALVRYAADNGTVENFFSRNGFCSPVKP